MGRWAIPVVPTQLTGAMFESKSISEFSLHGVYRPQTAMDHFESCADQRVNSFAWFELDGLNFPSIRLQPRLPWAPTYHFSEDLSTVVLNTSMHQEWWPQVLNLTGCTHWRMPFSNKVSKPSRTLHLASTLPTNSTWAFRFEPDGGVAQIPILVAALGSSTHNREALYEAVYHGLPISGVERVG